MLYSHLDASAIWKGESNLFAKSLEIIETLKKQRFEQVNFYVVSRKETNKGCITGL